MTKKNRSNTKRSKEDEKFPLPIYKKEDDIYNREKEEPIDEVEDAETGRRVKQDERRGEDLDVPGAELDDSDEVVGEEDEENNYYSLGGDAHDDLEEDKQ